MFSSLLKCLIIFCINETTCLQDDSYQDSRCCRIWIALLLRRFFICQVYPRFLSHLIWSSPLPFIRRRAYFCNPYFGSFFGTYISELPRSFSITPFLFCILVFFVFPVPISDFIIFKFLLFSMVLLINFVLKGLMCYLICFVIVLFSLLYCAVPVCKFLLFSFSVTIPGVSLLSFMFFYIFFVVKSILVIFSHTWFGSSFFYWCLWS